MFPKLLRRRGICCVYLYCVRCTALPWCLHTWSGGCPWSARCSRWCPGRPRTPHTYRSNSGSGKFHHLLTRLVLSSPSQSTLGYKWGDHFLLLTGQKADGKRWEYWISSSTSSPSLMFCLRPIIITPHSFQRKMYFVFFVFSLFLASNLVNIFLNFSQFSPFVKMFAKNLLKNVEKRF